MNEEWKSIPGYPYEASSLGRIKSVRSGIILKYRHQNRGYKRVNISVSGKHETKSVHGMVAEAFLGPRPDGMQCNHMDGNKDNCRIDNLEYVSPSENVKHAFRINLRTRGDNCKLSKVTSDQVKMIREMRVSSISISAISRQFRISRRQVHRIINKESWRDDEAFDRKTG